MHKPSSLAPSVISNPEDITHIVDFLHKHRSRVGQGGNFPTTVFNEAANYMAENWPPKKGGPRTANSIMSKYKVLRKLHEYILQALQKVYPGGSGWTYTHKLGFNVQEEDRDAWNNFSNLAHTHFKPFATRGERPAGDILQAHSQPQGNDDDNDPPPNPALTQLSDLSQPFSDVWSQSNYGDSQSLSQSSASHTAVAPPVPTTPGPTRPGLESNELRVPTCAPRASEPFLSLSRI
ncbi:hypothetical protein C8R47DRAFT_1062508 [Mycena vitilis]|nr:hypothetical protein C8R47DRAFT_1062508 [Mycena vitilis]